MDKEIRGLIAPLEGLQLVVPDSIVLQIQTSVDVIPVNDAPHWLLGVTEWQERKIPLVSYEAASGHREHDNGAAERALVLKSLNHAQHMPFYAMTLTGIPRPMNLNNDNIQGVESSGTISPLVLSPVLVEGEPACIPDLDALEEMLMSQYGLFKGTGSEVA